MDDQGHLDWEHLRSFEAVARLGSLTAAARALGVSQSTVSRHLSSLEARGGSPLFLRETPVALTERGAALLGAVQPMVEAALSARTALEATGELRGEVTLATVGELLRWELVPRLADFYREHPQLRLRILASNRLSSLAAGEADVALRMSRPGRGELVARKVGSVAYGYFAARSLKLGPQTPWLGLSGSLAALAEQQHAERAFAPRPARLLVEDVEALGMAVEAGLGTALLPRGLGERLGGVVEVPPGKVGARAGAPPTREIWAVVHRARQRIPKVQALWRWAIG